MVGRFYQKMVGSSLPLERYKTFRTRQNFRELDRTVLGFCIVLIRTARTFCEVLCVLLIVPVVLLMVLERSGTLTVLMLVLNAIWLLPIVLNKDVEIEHVDTVSTPSGIPYFCDGRFIKYLGR